MVATTYWTQKTKEYVTFLGGKVIAVKTSDLLGVKQVKRDFGVLFERQNGR